ncbi:MAG TPA: hypothetical protein PLJ21_13895 [Pseudobdellovibrionaceae bacterium]|nr:hypothetical protein [Pseudobdellovibrionaceae bacterium]
MNNEIFEQLKEPAFKRSIPFCYSCYEEAPTGCCKDCGSDDLMRLVPGVGCEWGADWVIKHILKTELTAVDLEEEFEESIRQCYPEETQVGWMTFDTVKLMKENDPVGWRCALADYESEELCEGNIMTFDNGSNYFRTQSVEDLINGNRP